MEKNGRERIKMDFRVIDMEQEPRREQYAYFRSLANPYVGVTVNLDVTALLEWTKANHRGFFLSFLYAAVRAANSVPELRRRIRGEQVVEYANCPSSHTVALDNGAYCYCQLKVNRTLKEFLTYAAEAQDYARNHPTLKDGEDGESLFFVSCVPWLSYTSMIQSVPVPADSNPRITWGKYFRQGEQTLMPVTLLAHHALVDGIHIARFYEALDREMAAIT